MKMQETVTVEKDLAPGVHVRIEGVPAVFRGSSTERRHYFDVKTAKRLEEMLGTARHLMREGETDIRLVYQGSDPEDLTIEFVSRGAKVGPRAYSEIFERVRCAFGEWSGPPRSEIRYADDAVRFFVSFHSHDEALQNTFRLFRNAVVHVSSSASPLAEVNEDVLSALQVLVPRRFSDIDQVSVHIASLPEVSFSIDSRKTVLESWLTLRRANSASAELHDISGNLQSFDAKHHMELKIVDSPSPLKVKYRAALSPLVHRLIGQSVLLTCIVEKRGGDEIVEAIDIELEKEFAPQ